MYLIDLYDSSTLNSLNITTLSIDFINNSTRLSDYFAINRSYKHVNFQLCHECHVKVGRVQGLLEPREITLYKRYNDARLKLPVVV